MRDGIARALLTACAIAGLTACSSASTGQPHRVSPEEGPTVSKSRAMATFSAPTSQRTAPTSEADPCSWAERRPEAARETAPTEAPDCPSPAADNRPADQLDSRASERPAAPVEEPTTTPQPAEPDTTAEPTTTPEPPSDREADCLAEVAAAAGESFGLPIPVPSDGQTRGSGDPSCEEARRAAASAAEHFAELRGK